MLSNPRDLFLQELAELLWIERTLEFELLPKLRDEAHDKDLRQAFAEHLAQTREHVARVEQAFRAAGAEAASARSEAFEGLKSQHERQAQQAKQSTLRDLVHAGGAARTEHVELAVYEALIGLARDLDLGESADLLERNRGDEDEALKLLQSLSERLRRALPR